VEEKLALQAQHFAPMKSQFAKLIHTGSDTKKSLISLRQKNKYVNYAMKACGIIIKRPFSGPQVTVC
jgi:hypothetical protein